MLRRLFNLLVRPPATGSAGVEAERLAAAWLRKHRGFSIVARNWRNPRDRREELDLVCRDGEVLVFVEVKARSATALVPGVYAVDTRKKRVLRRAARAYLAGLGPKRRTFRLDIVEVTLPVGGTAAADGGVLHFQNVPLFPKDFRG